MIFFLVSKFSLHCIFLLSGFFAIPLNISKWLFTKGKKHFLVRQYAQKRRADAGLQRILSGYYGPVHRFFSFNTRIQSACNGLALPFLQIKERGMASHSTLILFFTESTCHGYFRCLYQAPKASSVISLMLLSPATMDAIRPKVTGRRVRMKYLAPAT